MHLLTQLLLVLFGLTHLFVAVLFFFAPAWSFATIAHFPPHNAHFLADIGAFNLPLGVGLLIAARAPAQYRLLIGLAALGNLAHALSHLRDNHLHLPPNMPLLIGRLTQLATLLGGLILLSMAALIRPRTTRPSTAQKGRKS